MKMWVCDEMGQSCSDVEAAVKVEMSVPCLHIHYKFPQIFMPRKQRSNNQWRLVKSEIPVTFRMMCRLKESLMNAKIQMLD